MKKWNLVIDVAKCFNCNACAMACHDEYNGNSFPGYAAEKPNLGHRWIEIRQRERGVCPVVEVAYLPVTCNHCDDPPCMKAARDGAIQKRADGIVIIVPEKAKGQKQLVDACPYGAIWWNEELQLPQAWPFDAHLLDAGWTETRGSQVCSTGAWRTLHVEDEEMQRIAREDKLEVRAPQLGTRPRVYYKNMDRWAKEFIAGSVEAAIGGVTECVEGARITLEKDGKALAEALSDPYGDFRFGGLEQGSGAYTLRISEPRFASKAVNVTLGATAVLGAIALQPA
ncbi:MAG: carboxypeptidase regulatory-like domain-containing protein [Burkholderiales bacterium]|nr:carboxypeptidase regulatory-like domain-containing protein [Burkholderiales bacterium]